MKLVNHKMAYQEINKPSTIIAVAKVAESISSSSKKSVITVSFTSISLDDRQ